MEQQASEGNASGAAPKAPHWTHTYEKWDGWKDPDESAKKRDEEAKRLKNYRENTMSCAHDRSAERKVMEMPIEEKLEACREFRQKGNLFHEEGQYRRAALQYRQALIYYDFCFPDKEDDQQELDDIRQACLLNSAACFLACGELDQTMDCCYQALRAEPDNVKALYRRAVVYRLRDQFKEASADLGKALAQLPNEVALRKESAILKSKIASYRERSKAMGEQIFGKEGNDAGSSLSNAGTTSPLHGENRSTTEDQYPSDGDGEVVRNECSSVFAAGGASPGGVGRDGGQDSKHQQGRRRHDLSLPVCVDLTDLEEAAGCRWPLDG
eukprot:jgi/Undpi1/429/HiC_scaffold_1.g00425.m1